MKTRSKAELRSSVIRTIVLGLIFGLTFFQIEKTQTEPRPCWFASVQRKVLRHAQALFALNGCIFFVPAQDTHGSSTTRLRVESCQ